MAKKKMPPKLFMAWNYDCSDEPFLAHSKDVNDLVESGETVEAGVYELTEVVKLVNKTTVE